MNYCPDCGAKLTVNARFCFNCGRPLTAVPAADAVPESQYTAAAVPAGPQAEAAAPAAAPEDQFTAAVTPGDPQAAPGFSAPSVSEWVKPAQPAADPAEAAAEQAKAEHSAPDAGIDLGAWTGAGEAADGPQQGCLFLMRGRNENPNDRVTVTVFIDGTDCGPIEEFNEHQYPVSFGSHALSFRVPGREAQDRVFSVTPDAPEKKIFFSVPKNHMKLKMPSLPRKKAKAAAPTSARVAAPVPGAVAAAAPAAAGAAVSAAGAAQVSKSVRRAKHRENPVEHGIPKQMLPLSSWKYFLLSVLYVIPVVGLVFLLIHTFSYGNIHRRNFARSYWCRLLVTVLLILGFIGVLLVLGQSISGWIEQAFYDVEQGLYDLEQGFYDIQYDSDDMGGDYYYDTDETGDDSYYDDVEDFFNDEEYYPDEYADSGEEYYSDGYFDTDEQYYPPEYPDTDDPYSSDSREDSGTGAKRYRSSS